MLSENRDNFENDRPDLKKSSNYIYYLTRVF